ncbi:hypothetical protein AHAS_Ahas06G0018100 [Arachis hypogaea]
MWSANELGVGRVLGNSSWAGEKNGFFEEGCSGFRMKMNFCYDMEGGVLDLGSLPQTIVIECRYMLRSAFELFSNIHSKAFSEGGCSCSFIPLGAEQRHL